MTEIAREVLGAPSAGWLLRFDLASDAPGDGGWESCERLSERSRQRKEVHPPPRNSLQPRPFCVIRQPI